MKRIEDDRMERREGPTLDEQVERIKADVAEIAKKLGISEGEVVLILVERELVIINQQLSRVQQQLDAIYARVWGGAGG